MIQAGELAARRVNRIWLLSRAEVEAFTPQSQIADSRIRQARTDIESAPQPLVYFVERDGFVKIGTTRHLKSRLTALARGDCMIDGMTPGPVTLLATLPGDDLIEKRLHSRFRHLRVGGEWFLPDNELRALITQCAGAADRRAA